MEILRQKGVWLKYTLKKRSFVNNLDIGFLNIYTSYYEKKNYCLNQCIFFRQWTLNMVNMQIATKIFFYFTCDKQMYILLIENVIVIVLYYIYVYIYEAPCHPG